MLTANLMAAMDDDHLAQALYAEQDPLTASAAEVELLKRFEKQLDKYDEDFEYVATEVGMTGQEVRTLVDALVEANTSVVEAIALLKVLAEADISKPETLQQKLELATKFQDLLDAHTEALGDLAALLTTK